MSDGSPTLGPKTFQIADRECRGTVEFSKFSCPVCDVALLHDAPNPLSCLKCGRKWYRTCAICGKRARRCRCGGFEVIRRNPESIWPCQCGMWEVVERSYCRHCGSPRKGGGDAGRD